MKTGSESYKPLPHNVQESTMHGFHGRPAPNIENPIPLDKTDYYFGTITEISNTQRGWKCTLKVTNDAQQKRIPSIFRSINERGKCQIRASDTTISWYFNHSAEEILPPPIGTEIISFLEPHPFHPQSTITYWVTRQELVAAEADYEQKMAQKMWNDQSPDII